MVDGGVPRDVISAVQTGVYVFKLVQLLPVSRGSGGD